MFLNTIKISATSNVLFTPKYSNQFNTLNKEHSPNHNNRGFFISKREFWSDQFDGNEPDHILSYGCL